MGKYKTLGKNSLYVMIGTFGSKFISFLMLPLYTRWLSVSDFGLTDLLTIYSTLVTSIFSLSLNESIFVFPARQSKNQQAKYFTSGICTVLFMSIIVLIISFLTKLISNTYGIENSFTDNLWLIYALYFATAIQTYLQMFCQGINKMRTFCFAGIIYTGATAIFSFWLIPKMGVVGFVLANVFANLSSSLFIVLGEKIYCFFSFKFFDRQCLNAMLKYSVPMIPNTIMWWILSAINRPIINAHLGLEAIGLFAVANKLSSAVSSLTQIFTSSWQVSVLQEYGKKDFSEFFNNIGRTFFAVLILLSCSMAVFSPFIIKVTVDSKFFESWRFLPIISLAVVFNGLSSHAGTLFSATKTSKYFLYSSIAGAMCSIVFNILLIPWIGLYGASISFTLSQVAIGLYRLYFANRIIKYKYLYQFTFLLLGNIGLLVLIFFEKWIASYCLYLLIIGISIYFNRTYIISICKKCRLKFS